VSKYVVLGLLVVFQVLGDVWLSRGMRQIGAVSVSTPTALVAIGIQLLTNPWILLGVAFLLGALLLYLAAISRLDLSYVLPMTALKYVLSACLAGLILGESITPLRWVGTALISGGVLLVALGEATFERMKHKKDRQFHSVLLAPLSFSLSALKVETAILQSTALTGIVVMALAASIGDILLTAGMKQVGEVTAVNLRSLVRLARRALTNPLIGLGVLCLAADFFLFIALLGRADLSLIMPLTALSYPFSLLGSHYFLKEPLPSGRLAGTGLIGIGAAFILMNSIP
jgi:bacterial/archaeal transporter family protein